MAINVIAEIGCNHMGDIGIAKKMIDIAANYCKCKIVKFQKREVELYENSTLYKKPHPKIENSYGRTYGEHRKKLELSIDDHEILREYCHTRNVHYTCSVWDVPSAQKIIKLNPYFIKIPSACNLNFMLLEYLFNHWKGKIHISLGMTTNQNINKLYKYCIDKKRITDCVFYHCTSDYPVSFENVNALQIKYLKDNLSLLGGIGYSGHHLGIAVDILAFSLGASWIERHFTLDKTSKGTDHAASLEPFELKQLMQDLNDVSLALTQKPDKILNCEKEQYVKLKINNFQLWD